MTAKNYLKQAEYLNLKIDSDLCRLADLRALATNITATYSDMPRSATPNPERMAKVVDKIVDLEHQIDREVDYYVDLRREIKATVDKVSIPAAIVLDLHYFHKKTFEEIAELINYSTRWVQALHDKGLEEVQEIIDEI